MASSKKKSVLILGGTRFVGRHITENMIEAGYDVVLFNRGTSNASLFPDVESLVGDRSTNEYDALIGREFDIVVDTCAYIPRFVKEALNAVKCNHYIFISTVSVYADFSAATISEDSTLASTENIVDELVDGATYGPQKVLCEIEAMNHNGKVTILRPGLIVGAYDPTDRLSYWVHRTGIGGKMVAPGKPEDPIQFIDGADLASFVRKVAETSSEGIFNVVSTPGQFTIGGLLSSSKDITGSDAESVWIEKVEDFELQPWADLPAWVSPKGETKGLAMVSNKAAIDAGLKITQLSKTLTSIWEEIEKEGPRAQNDLKAGLKKEREDEVLQQVSR